MLVVYMYSSSSRGGRRALTSVSCMYLLRRNASIGLRGKTFFRISISSIYLQLRVKAVE